MDEPDTDSEWLIDADVCVQKVLYLEVPFINVDGSIPVPTERLLDTTDPVDNSIDALDAATVALLPVTKLAVTPPLNEEKSLYFLHYVGIS